MIDLQRVQSTETLIRFAQVSKSYAEAGRTRVVLNQVDAEFARGELIVLLGKSGSGKSTLLNLLSGIDTPSSGEVFVAGQSLHRLSERDRTLFRRRHIGFVFQFFNLVPTLTAIENLLLPMELNGKRGPSARQAALAMLGEVGLADRADTFPDRLSGGEQQRIAIARALVHDPDLVLADEPTGNLDSDTGRQILDLLDRLTRKAGKTMIMVTHSPEVVGYADRILRIREGKLVQESIPSVAA